MRQHGRRLDIAFPLFKTVPPLITVNRYGSVIIESISISFPAAPLRSGKLLLFSIAAPDEGTETRSDKDRRQRMKTSARIARGRRGRLWRFAGYNYIGFPEHPAGELDEDLIASRKERSKAVRRGRSGRERNEREREREIEREREREREREKREDAVVTAVEFHVAVSRIPRCSRKTRRGSGGLEMKFGRSDAIYTRMRKLGRLTVRFMPWHENPLYISALGAAASD